MMPPHKALRAVQQHTPAGSTTQPQRQQQPSHVTSSFLSHKTQASIKEEEGEILHRAEHEKARASVQLSRAICENFSAFCNNCTLGPPALPNTPPHSCKYATLPPPPELCFSSSSSSSKSRRHPRGWQKCITARTNATTPVTTLTTSTVAATTLYNAA